MPALVIERPTRRGVQALLIALLAGFGVASGAGAQQPSPRAAAERFYAAYMQLHVSGLPDAEQSKVLMPLFTPSVRRLFQGAALEQDRAMREQPDEKPPWVEGDLMSSLWEGAQDYAVGDPNVQGEHAEVPVRLTYADADTTLHWSDTLVLVRSGDDWLVDDILLNGDWAFKSGASLRQALGGD